MYSILVIGAGYLGAAVARDFLSKKQRVFALTRNVEKAAAFGKEGIRPVLADLTQPSTLAALPDAQFIVISAAPDKSDAEDYRKIYLDGMSNFLEAMRSKQRPYLIVLISSTSVWQERAGAWVDESIPADTQTEKGKILLASERLVLNSGYPSIVFRLSGIYGPGRNRLSSFKAGIWPKAGEPDGYMNMIHVRDAAGAMLPLFKKSKEGSIYIGSDDEPVLRSEFCRWLSSETGQVQAKRMDSSRSTGKRCRNAALKSLGFEFKYPSFRNGYQEFLKGEK